MQDSSGSARSNQEDPGGRYQALVKRIESARAELHTITDPDRRTEILDELGAATKALAELILQQKGRLRSPLE